MKDLIIVGAGPAGMASGLYAARKKIDFMIIAKEAGGQIARSSEVDNYLGTRNISGYELSKRFREHLKAYGAKIEDETVKKIERRGRNFVVKTGEKEYECRALVVATGKRSRKIAAKNADRFEGKGISYCATCDAPLFGEKAVAVVGGGNSAIDSVLQLEKYASKIYLIVRSDSLRADKIIVDKALSLKKVDVLYDSEIEEFKGNPMLEEIIVRKKDGGKRNIKLEGVFVEIGYDPNSEIIDFVEKNEIGEIKIDCMCKTSQQGVFAAGDITAAGAKQALSAAGQGATALISSFDYLSKNK